MKLNVFIQFYDNKICVSLPRYSRSIPWTVQTWKILDTHHKRNERTGISRPSYRLSFLPLPFSFSLPSSSPSTGQVVCGFSSRGRNARSMHLESRIDRLCAWYLSRIALVRIMVNPQRESSIFGDFCADSSLCENIFLTMIYILDWFINLD